LSSNLRRLLPIYFIFLFWSVLRTVSVNGPVMPLYVQSLGIGVIGWSVMATSNGLGMFFFEWIWGNMADRVNRRLLIIISLLAISVISPLYTLQFLIPYFLILQFFMGAFGVMVGPTTRVYVLDESPEKSVGLFASFWWAVSMGGSMLGPLIGTYLAQTYSFSCAFYASTALALVLACLVTVTFPKVDTSRRKREFRGHSSILRVRSAGLLFTSALFAFITVSLMKSFLPLYAKQQVNMSTFQVGVLLSATYAAQLAAMPLLGWLSDRFGTRRVTGIGLATSSVMFLFYFVAKTQPQLFLVSVMVSLMLAADSLLLALVPKVTSNTIYGAAVGIYGSFEDLGFLIGPLIFGFVWSAFNPVLIFAVASLAQLVSAILVLAIKSEQGHNVSWEFPKA
jgi:DHA1 family multidrug resistance protein-like MFS transporter